MSKGSARGRQVVLVVLDGWGYRPERDGNAIELHAYTATSKQNAAWQDQR